VKADPERAPHLERMRQHEKFDLRIDGRTDCRSRQPRVANLATIDEAAAMPRRPRGRRYDADPGARGEYAPP
jgi:hypothetical protein